MRLPPSNGGLFHRCILEYMGENTEAVDPLTPETFSFFDILDGAYQPKDEVEIYLDEAAAFEQRKLHNRVINQPDSGFTAKEKKEILKEKAAIEARLDASRYTFKLTGVDEDLVLDAIELVNKKFSVPRKVANGDLRQTIPEDKQVEYGKMLMSTVNALHIEQIVAPSGAVLTSPDVEEVGRFYDKAPSSQKQKLSAAIDALKVKASEFESRVDADF